jgi:hypothetical protein
VSRTKRTPAAGKHYDVDAKWAAAGKPLRLGGDGSVSSGELERLGLKVQVTEWGYDRGRSQITEIRIHAEQGLTGNLLRAIPLAEIERKWDSDRAGVVRVVRAAFGVDSLEELQKLLAELPEPGHRRDVPDHFYELVADIYTTQVNHRVRTPSAVIAKATGTPLSTTQGWVRRARLRGYLPPARRGSAG